MPSLIVIAGCNGAGKSTFASSSLLQIEHGEIVMMADKLPDYFKRRFPDIYTKIEQ